MIIDDLANVLMLDVLFITFAGPFLEQILGLMRRHHVALIRGVADLFVEVVAGRLMELLLLLLAGLMAGIPMLSDLSGLILVFFQ